MSKAIKIPLIIILILSCLVDALWLALYFVAPDKTTLNIYNVGELSGTEDKDGNKKSIIEVNSFKDCFEVKFNYYRDTNSNTTYSTGIQLINPSPESFCPGDEKISGFSVFWFGNFTADYSLKTSCPTYYYNSDENISFRATNSLVENDGFYISIGEDRYLMKFNNEYKYFDTVTQVTSRFNRRIKQDVMYFLDLLYDSISSIDTFTSGNITFEFGDLFDYYKETSSGVFEKDKEYDNSKIIELTKNYYNIKVNIHNTNIQRSEQSLFGQVGYNSNYFIGNISTSDYYTGLNNYILTEKDFNCVFQEFNTESNTEYSCKYVFVLKESVYKYVKSLSNINIIVKFNSDSFKNSSNIGFGSCTFTEESFFDLEVSHIYYIYGDSIVEVHL